MPTLVSTSSALSGFCLEKRNWKIGENVQKLIRGTLDFVNWLNNFSSAKNCIVPKILPITTAAFHKVPHYQFATLRWIFFKRNLFMNDYDKVISRIASDEELFTDFIVVAVVDDADGDSGAPDEEGFARAVFLDDGWQ